MGNIETLSILYKFGERVPLDRFIPLLKGSEGRIISIRQYGNLDILVADPYKVGDFLILPPLK